MWHPGLIYGEWRGSPFAGNRKPPDPSPPEAICARATAGDTAATDQPRQQADPGRKPPDTVQRFSLAHRQRPGKIRPMATLLPGRAWRTWQDAENVPT